MQVQRHCLCDCVDFALPGVETWQAHIQPDYRTAKLVPCVANPPCGVLPCGRMSAMLGPTGERIKSTRAEP